MRSPLLSLLAAVALSGCAGGGQATPDDATSRVTIVVGNEFAGTVTAYAVWPGGRRTRLGEVRQERTRTFETVRAGDEIALGLVLETAPPVGTTGGPTGFQGGAPARINPEMVMSEGIMISSGEGIEWRILTTGSLVYRRLVPE
jgi:hypothetical protein